MKKKIEVSFYDGIKMLVNEEINELLIDGGFKYIFKQGYFCKVEGKYKNIVNSISKDFINQVFYYEKELEVAGDLSNIILVKQSNIINDPINDCSGCVFDHNCQDLIAKNCLGDSIYIEK